MATPWHFKDTPEEFDAQLCIPEGSVTLTICDCEGVPLYKFDIHQEVDQADLDMFVARNDGPVRPKWEVLHRGLQYRDQ